MLEGTDSEDFPPPAYVDGDGARHRPRAVHPPPPKPTKKPKPKPQADAHPTPRRPPQPTPPAPSQPGPGGRHRRRGNGGGGDGGSAEAVRPDGPHLHPVSPEPVRRRRTRGRRRADPHRPVRALDERGGRRPGRPARPAAPLVGAGPGAAGAVRGRVRAVGGAAPALPEDQLGQRPGPLRQDVLLRHALPLHRPRLRRGALALRRHHGRYRRWSTPSGSPTWPGSTAKITQIHPSGPPGRPSGTTRPRPRCGRCPG